MKKTTKKKTNKKLISALGMFMLSAAMLGTSTYAWFTMNKSVSVEGMQLKAKTEQGLVISDYTKANWATSWDVGMSASAVLYPTSVAATSTPTFVHAESRYFDDEDGTQAVGNYTDLTLTWSDTTNSEGIGSSTSPAAREYVLLKNFYIKSTGETAWAQNLVIDEVNASIVGETPTAKKLDNSLRVLVVVGTNAFVYAPFQDVASGTTTDSYKWKNTANVTALAPATDSVCTSVTSIPNTDAGAINVKMYMFFEGEDENCKSSNIVGISPNDIEITATFKTQDVASGT